MSMMQSSYPQLNFADIFAGIGGFRLALEALGCRCVFSSEWDKFAQQSYQANFHIIPRGDITQISTTDMPDFDILTAGFPCQPFSNIGKREGFQHPTQGTLFYDIVRILADKMPKAFILENVEGLITHNKGRTFHTILDTLAHSINGQRHISTTDNLGYHVFWQVLDAQNYGVPQKRRRVFIVGIRSDSPDIPEFRFPKKETPKVTIANFVEENVTGYSISKHLQQSYIYKKDDGRPQVIDKNSQIQVKTLVSTYHKIQRLTGTFVRDGATGLRLLTEKECKAIMGFPDDFIIPVSRTQMYRQFGNSVAVPVVKAVARALLTTLQRDITETPAEAA